MDRTAHLALLGIDNALWKVVWLLHSASYSGPSGTR